MLLERVIKTKNFYKRKIEPVIDNIIRIFWGCVFIFFSILTFMGGFIAFFEDSKAPWWFLLIFVLASPVLFVWGGAKLFPRSIGCKLNQLIVEREIDKKVKLLSERGVFLALFFFSVSTIFLMNYNPLGGEFEKVTIIIMVCIFLYLGIAILFPEKTIEYTRHVFGPIEGVLGLIWKLFLIVLCVSVVVGLGFLIAYLPISLAIVIGAIIIAGALRR